jgi:hypothetical protein
MRQNRLTFIERDRANGAIFLYRDFMTISNGFSLGGS